MFMYWIFDSNEFQKLIVIFSKMQQINFSNSYQKKKKKLTAIIKCKEIFQKYQNPGHEFTTQKSI